jgi:hypothetical protein
MQSEIRRCFGNRPRWQTISYEKGDDWNGWDAGNGVPVQIYDYTDQSATSPGAYVSADFQYTAVLEPATYALLGIGGLAFTFLRHRKAGLIS